jgi:hypothetical protein
VSRQYDAQAREHFEETIKLVKEEKMEQAYDFYISKPELTRMLKTKEDFIKVMQIIKEKKHVS